MASLYVDADYLFTITAREKGKLFGGEKETFEVRKSLCLHVFVSVSLCVCHVWCL